VWDARKEGRPCASYRQRLSSTAYKHWPHTTLTDTSIACARPGGQHTCQGPWRQTGQSSWRCLAWTRSITMAVKRAQESGAAHMAHAVTPWPRGCQHWMWRDSRGPQPHAHLPPAGTRARQTQRAALSLHWARANSQRRRRGRRAPVAQPPHTQTARRPTVVSTQTDTQQQSSSYLAPPAKQTPV
jgi:hypothetical protein